MKGNRFAMIKEINEKWKREMLAISEMFRSRNVSRFGKKNSGISTFYLRGVTLKGTRELLVNKKICFDKF